VVGAIAPKLEEAEIARAKRKPTASLDAYDYYLRGMASFHLRNRQAINDAMPSFYKAIELDPEFAAAYGMAGWCLFWRKINGWMTDRSVEIAEGERLIRRAIELGKDDAVALARGGHALGHLVGDLDAGIALIDRALVLNPNSATAWMLGGFLQAFSGNSEVAIEHFARAMRLSPLDTEIFRMQTGTAFAHLLAGRFDSASSWAEKSFRDLPSFLFAVGIISASHALAGRMSEARRAMQHLRALDPTLRISNLAEWIPLRGSENLSRTVCAARDCRSERYHS
jgi:tetratricopeptide (TPR) repeat protein